MRAQKQIVITGIIAVVISTCIALIYFFGMNIKSDFTPSSVVPSVASDSAISTEVAQLITQRKQIDEQNKLSKMIFGERKSPLSFPFVGDDDSCFANVAVIISQPHNEWGFSVFSGNNSLLNDFQKSQVEVTVSIKCIGKSSFTFQATRFDNKGKLLRDLDQMQLKIDLAQGDTRTVFEGKMSDFFNCIRGQLLFGKNEKDKVEFSYLIQRKNKHDKMPDVSLDGESIHISAYEPSMGP